MNAPSFRPQWGAGASLPFPGPPVLPLPAHLPPAAGRVLVPPTNCIRPEAPQCPTWPTGPFWIQTCCLSRLPFLPALPPCAPQLLWWCQPLGFCKYSPTGTPCLSEELRSSFKIQFSTTSSAQSSLISPFPGRVTPTPLGGPWPPTSSAHCVSEGVRLAATSGQLTEWEVRRGAESSGT